MAQSGNIKAFLLPQIPMFLDGTEFPESLSTVILDNKATKVSHN